MTIRECFVSYKFKIACGFVRWDTLPLGLGFGVEGCPGMFNTNLQTKEQDLEFVAFNTKFGFKLSGMDLLLGRSVLLCPTGGFVFLTSVVISCFLFWVKVIIRISICKLQVEIHLRICPLGHSSSGAGLWS